MLEHTKLRTIAMIIIMSTLLHIALVSNVFATHAEQEVQLKQLNVLAEQFVEHVDAGNMDGARRVILQLNEDILGIHFQGLVNTEGVEALLEALISAQQVLSAISISEQQMRVSALKVRLAIDALTHPNHPMWLQYYKVLKDDGQHLERAIAAKDQAQIDAVLTRLMSHYELIRPALLINRQPVEVNKLDSYLQYLLTAKQTGSLEQFERLLNELFQRTTPTSHIEYEAMPYNSALWTSLIAGIIITVLGYVAWRKYEAI